MRGFRNPAVDRTDAFRGLFGDDDYRDVHAYFAAHPELSPSRLRPLTHLAASIGIQAVDAKDESVRFGLNAFKIVGVRYAVHRLGDAAAQQGLVCATAGNHGRAVARVARQKHLRCTVFIPAARSLTDTERRTRTQRIQAMREDHAEVIEVDGTYEDAVRRAAVHSEETGAAIVSDTSWAGYEKIPRWIMAGYTQIFEEAHAQWDAPPDVVLIQAGVGGLVCAAASWFTWRFGAARPYLIACEPETAACLLESARAGRLTAAGGSLDTIMAGLRCAEGSPAAWPTIASGIDAFVTVGDAQVLEAMRTLSSAPVEERVEAGPSGACGAAALTALASSPELSEVREACQLDRSTRALIVVTEGA